MIIVTRGGVANWSFLASGSHEDHRGKRLQGVQSYPTLTRSLLSMADRLACLGETRVVMEATAD
jgi:hypothetical protein